MKHLSQLFCILGLSLLVTACGKSDAPPAKSSGNNTSGGKLTLDPVATFAQSCARCHGPEGMFYALPFKHQGDDLRNTIGMMMTGNAQLNPTEADIDAMLQYHLQIREKMQSKTQ